ncbi:hypothetical protein AA0522_0927 [Gluconacetobacter liquefaciens NRIC 0522]|nr:hypothetical protein AA0522_0927 [Gluconacetobacter liquefaciens NRIC 0522]
MVLQADLAEAGGKILADCGGHGVDSPGGVRGDPFVPAALGADWEANILLSNICEHRYPYV